MHETRPDPLTLFVFIFRKHALSFSWPRIVGLGVVSAFNKGLSGGGYGPLVVSGQILSGHRTRNAVGITSLAEGLICMVGFALYLILQGGVSWFNDNWGFYLPIVLGALAAAPAAAWTTKAVSQRINLKMLIAAATCLLGAWTLWNTFK